MTALLLGATFLGTAACGGGGTGDEQAGASPSSSVSTGETGGSSPSATSAPTEGSGDRDCLVSGSPWEVSLRDLESQFPAVMSGINVTDVQIRGHQTLTVDGDLHATFADNSTTTIKVSMSQGLTMVMLQRHHGSASGTWEAHEGKLISAGPWTGGIQGSTKVTINGRVSESPFQAPTGGLADHPITYACADGTLNLTVEGSPFSYLLS